MQPASPRSRMAVLGMALLVMPAPNAVPTGRRPVPYGFYLPHSHYEALHENHALPIWLPHAMTLEEFARVYSFQVVDAEVLRAFHRQFGRDVPREADGMLPAGEPIWLPPARVDASTCCLWIHSLRDGWISTRPDSFSVGQLPPQFAHAAFDSGSIDIRLFPVPLAAQRVWQDLAAQGVPHLDDMQRAGLRPELRSQLEPGPWSETNAFAFSQWVGDRSQVARIQVSLPIAAVNGTLQFVERPQVRWLDAYGKDTAPNNPPESPTFLLLLSALGGAGLAALLMMARRRGTVGDA